ncbi:MAG: hypothetical protein ABI193_20650, partial [Minicystis sp.]
MLLVFVLVFASSSEVLGQTADLQEQAVENASGGGISVGESLSTGTVSFRAPLLFPSRRGGPLIDLRPRYSTSARIKEWGLGWDLPLCVERTSRGRSDRKPLSATADALASPWGELARASDGGWYARNLDPPVRVVEQEPGYLMALLPSGDVHHFGKVAVEKSRDVVTRWCLFEASAADGRTNTFDWAAPPLPDRWKSLAMSPRLYLSSASYGGVMVDGTYRASLAYEVVPDEQAVLSYSVTGPAWIDRRVAAVTVTRGATRLVQHTFRWKAGRGFRLERIESRLGSDDIADRSFDFEYEEDTPSLAVPSQLASVMSRSEIRQPFRPGAPFAQIFDFDADGVSDLEFRSSSLAPGSDPSAVVRLLAKDGFQPTHVQPAPTGDPTCWFAALQRVRPVVRPIWSPADGNLDIVYLTQDLTSRDLLTLCDAQGRRVATQLQPTLKKGVLPGAIWPNYIGLGDAHTPLFFDADGDGRVDLVDVDPGHLVTTYRNLSELRGPKLDQRFFFFEQPAAVGLEVAVSGRLTAGDANADGLTDLMAFKEGSGRVELNDGGSFLESRSTSSRSARALSISVKLPDDVAPDTCSTTLHDADVDGWAEPWLVCNLKDTNLRRLYRGVDRHVDFSDAQARAHRYTAALVPGVQGEWIHLGSNFDGTGGFAAVFFNGSSVLTSVLSAPSVGRITRFTDRERGESIQLTYGLPPSGNNIGIGAPVIREVVRAAAGGPRDTMRYEYAGPQYAVKRRAFLGF